MVEDHQLVFAPDSSMLDDESGDPTAEVVVQDARLRSRVSALARRLAGGGLRAEDLEQEIWVEVLVRLNRGVVSLGLPLLDQVHVCLHLWAREACRSARKKARREALVPDRIPEREAAPADAARLARGELRRLARALPSADQQHLALRLRRQPAAVADALGMDAKTERRAWRRIRTRLQDLAAEGGA